MASKHTKQQIGGLKRSQNLSAQERRAIAVKAAEQRWGEGKRGVFTPAPAQAEHSRPKQSAAARVTAAQRTGRPQAQDLRTTRADNDGRVLIQSFGAGVVRCKRGQVLGDFYT